MTPLLTGVDLGGHPELPLLVVGPSLGTSVEALWGSTAKLLAGDFRVVGWDLPGHGRNRQIPTQGFSMTDLAVAVLALADTLDVTSFLYAGDSIGGAVGQQLLLDAPDRVRAAALVCTAARFDEPEDWLERAALVRRSSTSVMVEASAKRWFPDTFNDQHPEVATALLDSLRSTDAAGYAACCEALAGFDVRGRLGEVAVPVLVVSGVGDAAAPPAEGRLIAETVRDGRLVALDGVGHMAPAEVPHKVARLLRSHFAGPSAGRAEMTAVPTAWISGESATAEAGMRVRREVLGDEHVDRASADATDFSRDFQELITRYAWGEIWSRPGLDRRSRSMITLTAMIARGHHEEFAMHVRAGLRNGLTGEEIKEVILQSAIYCGVPDANTAFRIAQRILDEVDQRSIERER